MLNEATSFKFVGTASMTLAGNRKNVVNVNAGTVWASGAFAVVQAVGIAGEHPVLVTSFCPAYTVGRAVVMTEMGDLRFEEQELIRHTAGGKSFKTKRAAITYARENGISYISTKKVYTAPVVADVGRSVSDLDRVCRKVHNRKVYRESLGYDGVAEVIRKSQKFDDATTLTYSCWIEQCPRGTLETVKYRGTLPKNVFCPDCGAPAGATVNNLKIMAGAAVTFPAELLNASLVRPFPAGIQPVRSLHNWEKTLIRRLENPSVLEQDVETAEKSGRRILSV